MPETPQPEVRRITIESNGVKYVAYAVTIVTVISAEEMRYIESELRKP